MAHRKSKYMKKLLKNIGNKQLTPGFHPVMIKHDSWCNIFKGGACNCNPEIETPTIAGKN